MTCQNVNMRDIHKEMKRDDTYVVDLKQNTIDTCNNIRSEELQNIMYWR